MNKPTTCRHCREPLEQPATGRPRQFCPAAACQRRAEAERKVRRRRRQAGIPNERFIPSPWDPNPPFLIQTRYRRGGRDPLARRIARTLARERLHYVQPTEDEWLALDAAARVGATRGTDLSALVAGEPHWRTKRILPPSARTVLGRLLTRDREADPEYWQKRQARSEKRGRRKKMWEEFGRRVEQQKARVGNLFVQLFEQIPAPHRQSVFRVLAKAFHPDLGGDEALMKLLNQAWEVQDGAPASPPPAAATEETRHAEDIVAEEMVREFLARLSK